MKNPLHLLLSGLFPVLLAAGAAAQCREFVLPGTATGDGFGSALANLGDLDGDGLPEIAIGAPAAHAGQGGVSVISSRTGRILMD
ncbi:MAG TPA: FG-GAP repeat protein, partial [Planctomycetota bacterium]